LQLEIETLTMARDQLREQHEADQAAKRTEAEATARAVADQINLEQRTLDELRATITEYRVTRDELKGELDSLKARFA